MRFRAGMIITIATVICLFLDSVVFARLNIADIRPEMMIALAVSLGITTGSMRAGIVCGCLGLLNDILFCKMIGLNAMTYLVAGVVSGLFFGKFYARNFVAPFILASALNFFRDIVFAIAAALTGSRLNFGLMLVSYIIPCALFTGVMGIPVYLCLRPMLARYGKYISERGGRYI